MDERHEIQLDEGRPGKGQEEFREYCFGAPGTLQCKTQVAMGRIVVNPRSQEKDFTSEDVARIDYSGTDSVVSFPFMTLTNKYLLSRMIIVNSLSPS